MSKKRKFGDIEDDDPALQGEGQVKRAKVTSPTATMLLDLPLELLEHILLEAIISEVRDRKILRGAWKKSADRVVERLRNVCPQWDYVLTTDSFQKRLHGIIDKYPQVEICFNVLARRRCSNFISLTILNDEIFILCHRPPQQAHVEVYANNEIRTVRSSIQLPGVNSPWNLVACSVSNCLYVLHQSTRDVEILRVSKEGQQFQVSHFITCSTQLVSRLCVAGDGRLIIFQGPAPAKITVYAVDGTLERQIELEKPISSINGVLAKSNGNFMLVKKTTLTEVGRDGNTLYEYKCQTGELLYGAIDQYDRVVLIDDCGSVRLLDSELNPVEFQYQLDAFQYTSKHFYRVSYNRQRNVWVALETAAFCDNDADQCLTVFNFTERNVPNDTKNKQN